MGWRLLALLCWVPVLGGCGSAQASPAAARVPAVSCQSLADTQPLRADFPFPVMAGWIERDRLREHGPASRQLTGTWIHEGDAITQAGIYRRALEAAGYRMEPGRLSGNAQAAFAGTTAVAGQCYRFTVDFAREAGDQRVTLVFTPC